MWTSDQFHEGPSLRDGTRRRVASVPPKPPLALLMPAFVTCSFPAKSQVPSTQISM